MIKFKLVFYKEDKIVREWKGYHSALEARSAYRDADRIIPLDNIVKIECYDEYPIGPDDREQERVDNAQT